MEIPFEINQPVFFEICRHMWQNHQEAPTLWQSSLPMLVLDSPKTFGGPQQPQYWLAFYRVRQKKNHNLCSRYTVSLSPIKIQHLTLCPVIKKRSKSKSKLFQNKNQCFGCCLGHLLLLTKQTWIFVYYCYFDSPFKFNTMGFSYMLSEATLANFSAFIAHFGL